MSNIHGAHAIGMDSAWESEWGLPEKSAVNISHKGKLKVSDQREKPVAKGISNRKKISTRAGNHKKKSESFV